MDYVDRDVILRKMQKIATEAWKMKRTANVETVWNEAMDVIKSIPSADVAPVVHKWIEEIDWAKNDVYGRCSVCGYETESYKCLERCPNCDAAMVME